MDSDMQISAGGQNIFAGNTQDFLHRLRHYPQLVSALQEIQTLSSDTGVGYIQYLAAIHETASTVLRILDTDPDQDTDTPRPVNIRGLSFLPADSSE
jgi:hypothetical protein